MKLITLPIHLASLFDEITTATAGRDLDSAEVANLMLDFLAERALADLKADQSPVSQLLVATMPEAVLQREIRDNISTVAGGAPEAIQSWLHHANANFYRWLGTGSPAIALQLATSLTVDDTIAREHEFTDIEALVREFIQRKVQPAAKPEIKCDACEEPCAARALMQVMALHIRAAV